MKNCVYAHCSGDRYKGIATERVADKCREIRGKFARNRQLESTQDHSSLSSQSANRLPGTSASRAAGNTSQVSCHEHDSSQAKDHSARLNPPPRDRNSNRLVDDQKKMNSHLDATMVYALDHVRELSRLEHRT